MSFITILSRKIIYEIISALSSSSHGTFKFNVSFLRRFLDFFNSSEHQRAKQNEMRNYVKSKIFYLNLPSKFADDGKEDKREKGSYMHIIPAIAVDQCKVSSLFFYSFCSFSLIFFFVCYVCLNAFVVYLCSCTSKLYCETSESSFFFCFILFFPWIFTFFSLAKMLIFECSFFVIFKIWKKT